MAQAERSQPVQSLFDLLRLPETLAEHDLAILASFGVRRAVLSLPATTEAGVTAKQETARLRRAGIVPFLSFGLSPGVLPGAALEAELQRLPGLLSLPRAIALGPLSLRTVEPGAEYAFERMLALAAELHRPIVIRSEPAATGREVRRLLALVRASRFPPENVLGVSLPASALVLFRECGHAIGVGQSRALPGRQLVETVQRLGSERLLLVGEGGDFLSLPKAAGLLEEGKLPAAVVRRVALENALKFFRIDEP